MHFWEQIYANVAALMIIDLNETTEEIKAIRKYINPMILKLEHRIQIVIAQTSHLFTKYAD